MPGGHGLRYRAIVMRRDSLLVWLTVAVPILYFGTILVAAATWPGYSHVTRYVSDNRDPQIIDDEMRIARFVRAGTDETIATLVNFGSHPEYSGDSNQLLSADIVHFLRDGIENGLVGPDGTTMVPGVGGVAMLFQSAIGSQIGPQRVNSVAWDGTVHGDMLTLELAETVGTQLGYFALRALGPTAGATTDEKAAWPAQCSIAQPTANAIRN